MKKSFLSKKLSKYKVSKVVLEMPIISKKDVLKILQQRGYVEHDNYWLNAFIKVTVLDSFIQIEHTISKENNGVKCFYDKDILLEFLRYFEYKFKR